MACLQVESMLGITRTSSAYGPPRMYALTRPAQRCTYIHADIDHQRTSCLEAALLCSRHTMPPGTARESSRARSKLDEPPTDEPFPSSRGMGDDSDSYLTKKFGDVPRPVMAQRRLQHGMEGIKSAAGSGWEPKTSSRGQHEAQLPPLSAVGSRRSQRPSTRGVAQTAR